MLTLLKTRLFNLPTMFVLGMVGLIAFVLLTNSDTVLSKFGFETTSTLKAELARTQAELDRLAKVNQELIDSIEEIKRTQQAQIEALSNFYKEEESKKTATVQIVETKQTKIKDLNKKVAAKTKSTKDTVTLPTQELNNISETNISALIETKALLFKEGVN